MSTALTIRTSPRGRKLLEGTEGNRLVAYLDSRGVVTIGRGHTGMLRGVPLKLGMMITEAESVALFDGDLAPSEGAVAIATTDRLANHAPPPTQEMIDALVSFIFNEGIGHWGASSVRSAYVRGLDHEVAWALFQWTKAGADATILASRRAREAFLYSRGMYLDAKWKEIFL